MKKTGIHPVSCGSHGAVQSSLHCQPGRGKHHRPGWQLDAMEGFAPSFIPRLSSSEAGFFSCFLVLALIHGSIS
jgi:hypothetical protein